MKKKNRPDPKDDLGFDEHGRVIAIGQDVRVMCTDNNLQPARHRIATTARVARTTPAVVRALERRGLLTTTKCACGIKLFDVTEVLRVMAERATRETK